MMDEPLFMLLRESDPKYQATVRAARESLPEFRELVAACGASGVIPCIKTTLVDGEKSAPFWLTNAQVKDSGFAAMVFEIPPEFPSYSVGTWIEVAESGVLDWMVNEHGVLHGGFSLRYQRSLLPEEKRAWFDRYVGVTTYA